MEFYYPNFQNDMWRIFGLCFFADKGHFVVDGEKRFDIDAIKAFLEKQRIALYDTATRVRRTKDTASDKDLDIVEETNIGAMLRQLHQCKAVVTAGQLATSVFCRQFGIKEPKVGQHTEFDIDGRTVRLYRMPSSSRAYPMAVERKAEHYETVFNYIKRATDKI